MTLTRPEGRIFAIGDVHGCRDKLVRLLGKIPADFERDTIVFIGDYIDRGPDSKGVVDVVLDLMKKCPNVICLKGNHEDLFINYLSGANEVQFIYNGGGTTLRSYGVESYDPLSLSPEHRRFFESLKMYYLTPDYLFVHAGIRPTVPLEAQRDHDLLWIREEFIYATHDLDQLIVFGHTPFKEPKVLPTKSRPDKIGIDTGAVYGHQLTCLQLPERRFIQAK